jgi:hypothetical protein
MSRQASPTASPGRPLGGFNLVWCTAPAIAAASVALAIGGTHGEAVLAGGLVAASAGFAAASVLGAISRRPLACLAALGAFFILACYVYARARGIPTEEIRLGIGLVALAMGLAGGATTGVALARGPR